MSNRIARVAISVAVVSCLMVALGPPPKTPLDPLYGPNSPHWAAHAARGVQRPVTDAPRVRLLDTGTGTGVADPGPGVSGGGGDLSGAGTGGADPGGEPGLSSTGGGGGGESGMDTGTGSGTGTAADEPVADDPGASEAPTTCGVFSSPSSALATGAAVGAAGLGGIGILSWLVLRGVPL